MKESQLSATQAAKGGNNDDKKIKKGEGIDETNVIHGVSIPPNNSVMSNPINAQSGKILTETPKESTDKILPGKFNFYISIESFSGPNS